MACIAVVGVGYWGPNLVRNLAAQPGCEQQIWVCDRDAQRLALMQRRLPGLRYVADYDEVLASDVVDAVMLATPVSTHFEMARRAMQAGKHVFVEKPLATSSAAAVELVELAEARRRVLMVGHTFLYSPPVMRIKKLIDAGELGRIFFTSSMRVNLGLHQRDASVIWDLAPHDFSILFWWLGEVPISISATGGDFVQPGIPDVAFITARFPSGTLAKVEVSWLAPSKLRRTAVVGDRRMLVYDDTETVEKIRIYDRGVDFKDPQDFGEFQLSYRTGDILIPMLEQFEPLAAQTSDFLRAISDGRAVPRSDARAALSVVRALEAAERSLGQGGAPVALST